MGVKHQVTYLPTYYPCSKSQVEPLCSPPNSVCMRSRPSLFYFRNDFTTGAHNSVINSNALCLHFHWRQCRFSRDVGWIPNTHVFISTGGNADFHWMSVGLQILISSFPLAAMQIFTGCRLNSKYSCLHFHSQCRFSLAVDQTGPRLTVLQLNGSTTKHTGISMTAVMRLPDPTGFGPQPERRKTPKERQYMDWKRDRLNPPH